MKNPLVSIALCTYNGEKYLEEQLLSLINQTYDQLEIIIFDDASTDSTIEIIEKYGFESYKIKLFKNSENLGYIKNFENTISNCNGKYIFLCDQDDIWDVEKVEKVVKQFNQDTLLIFHNSEFIDSAGISILKNMDDRFTLNQNITPLSFLLFNGISGHALAFESSIIKEILPFPKIVHHDCWISFIAACNGNIKYLPNCFVKYRQHNNSETDLLKIKNPKIKKKSSSDKNSLLIERTNHFATVKFNPQQKQFIKFKELLIKRQSSFFSYYLFIFVVRYGQSIFSFKRKKGILRLFYSFPYIWGMKIKTIL